MYTEVNLWSSQGGVLHKFNGHIRFYEMKRNSREERRDEDKRLLSWTQKDSMLSANDWSGTFIWRIN